MPKKILIIEDEQALAKNLALLLRDDYIVETVGNGNLGLAKAKAWQPDLILLDINLPDMDGVEIMQHLRHAQATETIPVVVLTNLSDTDSVSRMLKAGGIEYLVKADHSLEEVAARVQQLLA